MVVNPENQTSSNTHYQDVFLKYVENEYCAKLRSVPFDKPESVPSNNLVLSLTAPGSGQSSFDPYDLSTDDTEYLIANTEAETTPRESDRTARWLSAARLYLNSLPEAPKNCGQINPNLNDYHSDPMEISSKCWIPDITDWWCEHEETHSKYADLSNVSCDIFSIIPHVVRVEASFSLGRDDIAWRNSKTTGEIFHEHVIVRQFARANNGILAGVNPGLDKTNTENDSEMNKEGEDRQLHRLSKVHNLLEMWQGSQNLRATQKESCTHNKQKTAGGYLSDTEEIVKASMSLFQHDAVAAF